MIEIKDIEFCRILNTAKYTCLNSRNILFAQLFHPSPAPTSPVVNSAFEVAMNRLGDR